MRGVDRPVHSAGKALAIAFALLAPARMGWIALTVGENNLSNDYLGRIPVVAALLEGRYSLGGLFRYTWIGGGHSWLGLLPIYWFEARFFAWDVRVELGIGLVFAALKTLLFWLALAPALSAHRRWFLLPVLFALAFSVAQTSSIHVRRIGSPVQSRRSPSRRGFSRSCASRTGLRCALRASRSAAFSPRGRGSGVARPAAAPARARRQDFGPSCRRAGRFARRATAFAGWRCRCGSLGLPGFCASPISAAFREPSSFGSIGSSTRDSSVNANSPPASRQASAVEWRRLPLQRSPATCRPRETSSRLFLFRSFSSGTSCVRSSLATFRLAGSAPKVAIAGVGTSLAAPSNVFSLREAQGCRSAPITARTSRSVGCERLSVMGRGRPQAAPRARHPRSCVPRVPPSRARCDTNPLRSTTRLGLAADGASLRRRAIYRDAHGTGRTHRLVLMHERAPRKRAASAARLLCYLPVAGRWEAATPGVRARVRTFAHIPELVVSAGLGPSRVFLGRTTASCSRRASSSPSTSRSTAPSSRGCPEEEETMNPRGVARNARWPEPAPAQRWSAPAGSRPSAHGSRRTSAASCSASIRGLGLFRWVHLADAVEKVGERLDGDLLRQRRRSP